MKSFTRGHLKAGLTAVRSTKFRSFWTMFGVIIGVSSVITVVAIGQGIKHQISNQIQHLGPRVITVVPGQIATSSNNPTFNFLSGSNIAGALTDRDDDVISATPGVVASSPLTVVSGSVRADNGPYSSGFVIGTSPDLPTLINQSIASGGYITSDQMGTNVAVLGANAAQKMFNEDVPLGRSLTIRGQTFVVIGIFNSISSTPLSNQVNLNNAIFIPSNTAETLADNSATTYEILAQSDSSLPTTLVVKRIRGALNKEHGGISNISVQSGEQDLSTSSNVLSLLTKLIAGVASISLLVGGIGIMDVMLVSVAERTHEIGIRKAIGAQNSQIMSQFLVEATIISLIGGLIGIAISFAVDGLLRAFSTIHPIISWPIVVLASGVSLIVGIVFGTIPAIKAARKNPIEALRDE